MKVFVILLVLIGFAGIAWAEVALSVEPTSAKFGDDVIIHASVPSYENDTLRYYVDVLDSSGKQIDSTLWFVREDFNYTMRTIHPAYQILRGGEFTIQAEQAINNIERTGNIVQTTLFFLSNPPPLYQLKGGIVPENVICNDELVLIQKYDGSPACVKSDSFEKLYLRGWGDCAWNCSHPIPENIIEHSRKLAYMDKTMDVHGTEHSVKYRLDGNATVTDSIYSEDSASVIITLDAITSGSLTIELPRTLIDSGHSNCDPSYEREDSFAVLIDNVEVRFEEIVTTSEKRTLSISFQENTKKIEIVSFCLI